MSNFLKRNALSGGVAMLSLLGVLIVTVTCQRDRGIHGAQHAAEAPKTGSDKASPTSQNQAPQAQQMDHGSMSHEGMDHEKMMEGHGGKTEAGSNHDQ